jgi:diaminopimelate decarboxylase
MSNLLYEISKLGTPIYFYLKEKILENSQKLKNHFKKVKFAIENGVEFFNFDSLDQLLLLEETAKELNKTIKALMRIKPLVDVETHSHLQTGTFTSKFGLSDEEIDEVIIGIHSNIGSNIKDEEPYNELSNKYQIFIEPRRYLIAKKGYPHDFLVIDCGMSELIRPALYSAYHPICESSDVFGEYFLPNMKREKPLEILIENDKFEIINERKFL